MCLLCAFFLCLYLLFTIQNKKSLFYMVLKIQWLSFQLKKNKTKMSVVWLWHFNVKYKVFLRLKEFDKNDKMSGCAVWIVCFFFLLFMVLIIIIIVITWWETNGSKSNKINTWLLTNHFIHITWIYWALVMYHIFWRRNFLD